MTIRVGANPSSIYVGIQTGVSSANLVSSGALSPTLSLVGTGKRHLFGSGAVDLPNGMTFQVIAVQPVIRRGSGSAALPGTAYSGSGGRTGHPHAIGTIAPALSIVGSGKRKPQGIGDIPLDLRFSGFAENNGEKISIGELVLSGPTFDGTADVIQHISSDGDVPLELDIVGDAIIHQQVTASGAIDLALLSVHDVTVSTTLQIIPIEGVFIDPAMEGTFIDSIAIEGAT